MYAIRIFQLSVRNRSRSGSVCRRTLRFRETPWPNPAEHEGQARPVPNFAKKSSVPRSPDVVERLTALPGGHITRLGPQHPLVVVRRLAEHQDEPRTRRPVVVRIFQEIPYGGDVGKPAAELVVDLVHVRDYGGPSRAQPDAGSSPAADRTSVLVMMMNSAPSRSRGGPRWIPWIAAGTFHAAGVARPVSDGCWRRRFPTPGRYGPRDPRTSLTSASEVTSNTRGSRRTAAGCTR